VSSRPTVAPDSTVPVSHLPTEPIEWLTIVLILGAFVAAELRWMRAGLEYDEMYTATHFVLRQSLWTAISSVTVFNNHMAYSIVTNLVARVLGSAEWALRLPAITLGALTIVATWRFARFVAGKWVAGIVAVLLPWMPMFFSYSHLARGYTGLTLMCVLSSWSFIVLLRQPSPTALMVHALSTTLAVYFNLYGMAIILVQYPLFVWQTVIRSTTTDRGSSGLSQLWLSFVLIPAAVLVLYSPAIMGLLAVIADRGRAPLRTTFPAELLDAFVIARQLPVRAAIMLLIVAGLIRLKRVDATYMALLLTVPFVTMWYFLRPSDLYVRLFLFWTPLYVLLIGNGIVGIARWSWQRRLWAMKVPALSCVVAGCVGVAFMLVESVRRDTRHPPDAFRYLLQPASRQHVPSFSVGVDADMYEYYLPHPYEYLRAPLDLDRVMRSFDRFQVIYNISDATPIDRQMESMLRARCTAEQRFPVIIFRCPD
jgi:hypothetical protein